MKKMLALLVALLLAVCPAAIADGELTDADILAAASDEELFQLQSAIISELLSRGAIEELVVPTGEYTVGTDLPAGVYSGTGEIATVTVNKMEQMYVVTDDNPLGKMTLKDGDVLSVAGSSVTLTPYAGLMNMQ